MGPRPVPPRPGGPCYGNRFADCTEASSRPGKSNKKARGFGTAGFVFIVLNEGSFSTCRVPHRDRALWILWATRRRERRWSKAALQRWPHS